MPVEIPHRMKHLPVDRRGYPTPVIVVTNDGDPVFSVNDIDAMNKMIAEDRCSICGTKLFRGQWLVGGGLSALSTKGKFADGPLHDECAHYALKVCPYLAAPNWKTPIGKFQHAKAGLAGAAFDLKDSITVADTERPEAFVAVMASKIEIEIRPFGVLLCRPKEGHVMRAEVWRNGTMLQGTDVTDFIERMRPKVEKYSAMRTDICKHLTANRV